MIVKDKGTLRGIFLRACNERMVCTVSADWAMSMMHGLLPNIELSNYEGNGIQYCITGKVSKAAVQNEYFNITYFLMKKMVLGLNHIKRVKNYSVFYVISDFRLEAFQDEDDPEAIRARFCFDTFFRMDNIIDVT